MYCVWTSSVLLCYRSYSISRYMSNIIPVQLLLLLLDTCTRNATYINVTTPPVYYTCKLIEYSGNYQLNITPTRVSRGPYVNTVYTCVSIIRNSMLM